MPTLPGLAAATVRLARLGTTPADAALALGITAIVCSELTAKTVASPPVAIAATVPVVFSLAWRRRRPVPVAIAICALSVLLNLTATNVWGAQLMALPVTLSIYTVAAHSHGAAAWFGGTTTLVLVAVAHAATDDGELTDFIAVLIWAASWLAGRVVRRRTLEAAEIATDATLRVHRLEAQTRETAARERDRIARELHDVVAHAVSLVVVQAGAERLALGEDMPRTRGVLDAIETAGRQALVELRAMLAVLRSPDDDPATELGPQPDLGGVPSLVERVREAGLPVRLDLRAVGPLPPGVGLSAYRIVQEALTNALKHGAVSASVTVDADDGTLTVEVRSPLPAPGRRTEAGAGRGLVGMHERAALHGGQLRAGPDGESEWVVLAQLPLGVTAGSL